MTFHKWGLRNNQYAEQQAFRYSQHEAFQSPAFQAALAQSSLNTTNTRALGLGGGERLLLGSVLFSFPLKGSIRRYTPGLQPQAAVVRVSPTAGTKEAACLAVTA